MLRHLKVRHTLKILQHLLQDFWSVSGHFGTLCIKGLTGLISTWGEISKMMQSLLAVRKISLFEVHDMCCIHLQSYRRRNTIWFWLINVWQWQLIWKRKWRAFSHSNYLRLKELKCYFLLVAVPSLVDQLDISQSFFKIRACILIISLLCIFAYISNNFTKK